LSPGVPPTRSLVPLGAGRPSAMCWPPPMALGDVVAGELDVDAARIALPSGAVHLEEAGPPPSQHVVEVPGLVARWAVLDRVAVQSGSPPPHTDPRVPLAATPPPPAAGRGLADSGPRGRSGLIQGEAGPGLAVGIEGLDQREHVPGRVTGARADLDGQNGVCGSAARNSTWAPAGIAGSAPLSNSRLARTKHRLARHMRRPGSGRARSSSRQGPSWLEVETPPPRGKTVSGSAPAGVHETRWPRSNLLGQAAS